MTAWAKNSEREGDRIFSLFDLHDRVPDRTGRREVKMDTGSREGKETRGDEGERV
jgi:hypothetical protein